MPPNLSRVCRIKGGMSLRSLIALVLLLPLGAAALPGYAAAPTVVGQRVIEPTAQQAADGRPNIVVITTDDQTAMELKWMPRTRAAIGDAGIDFTKAISPHPLCCPARAELLTGQYAQNNGVRSNSGKHGGFHSLKSKGNTVASWLQGAGYRTGMVGKFLNLYRLEDGRQKGWDYWNPTIRGILTPYNYTMFNDDPLNTETQIDGIHNTDLVSLRTQELVEKWAPQSQPFFVWASFVAPHGDCYDPSRPNCSAPPTPPHRYRDIYPDLTLPTMTKPSYNERWMGDKPKWMRKLPAPDPTYLQLLFTQRVRALAAVDEAVADIVESLRVSGELDNTLVIFSSDNGYLLGEHRLDGKVWGFQESLRVPLLMRGPGIEAGRTSSQVATWIDLAPTIVDAADALAQRRMDGLSLLPVAAGAKIRRTPLIQAGPRKPMGTRSWTYRGVTTKRYTLMRWNKTGFVELYDRKNDPYELQNRAKKKRYRAVRKELIRRTDRLKGCRGEACLRDFGPDPKPKRPKRRR